jgi:dTDP-4-amino-4,6-dideoxygalactose transaminase
MYGVPGNFQRALCDLALGRVHAGDDVARFEQEICRLSGSRHAVAMPQARVGIHLTLKALIQRSGRRKVILSPYTIYDVVNMVVSAGGIPVFVDVDANNGNIDPAEVAATIDDETAAVLVTHLHGIMCDMNALLRVCQALSVPIVEDAAQALGAHSGNKAAGAIGAAGVFSFGRAKNVNCFYGGAVVTDDDDLARALRSEIATYPDMGSGRLAKRVLICLAYSLAVSRLVFPIATQWLYRLMALSSPKRGAELLSTERNPVLRTMLPEASKRRLTPMQARCAIEQLSLLETHQRKRQRLVAIYREGLADIPAVRLPVMVANTDNVFLPFPIQVLDRVALQQCVHALSFFIGGILIAKYGVSSGQKYRREIVVRLIFAKHFENIARLFGASFCSGGIPGQQSRRSQKLLEGAYFQLRAELELSETCLE